MLVFKRLRSCIIAVALSLLYRGADLSRVHSREHSMHLSTIMIMMMTLIFLFQRHSLICPLLHSIRDIMLCLSLRSLLRSQSSGEQVHRKNRISGPLFVTNSEDRLKLVTLIIDFKIILTLLFEMMMLKMTTLSTQVGTSSSSSLPFRV